MLVFRQDEEIFNLRNECVVKVCWEGKPVESADSDLTPPSFNVQAFRKNSVKAFNVLESTYDLCNKFFQTLEIAHQWTIFRYFQQMEKHFSIIQNGDRETWEAQRNLMALLTEEVFLTRIPLYECVMGFIDSLNLTFPEMGGKGKRVQDSVEKTFTTAEYPYVSGLCLVCKMLIPIIGNCLSLFKFFCHEDIRELKTYEIFNGLFYADSSKFRPIYDKIKYYIESEVKNCLKKNKNRNKGKTSNCTFTLATNGFSEDLFIESIEATVMCRKIVRFDFFDNKEEDKIPDIMVAIYTGVAYSVDPTLVKWRDNSKYWASFSPSDSTTTEDNTSFLEYGSKSSSVPYDLGIMVEISVDNVIPRILADFQIDQDLFKKCLLFYERSQVIDTPFNSSMICSLLSKYIGGPSQIHRVKYRQYRQLVSIVQLRMLQWNLKRLIGFVSCTSDSTKSSEISAVIIRNKNFDKLEEFQEFRRLCPGYVERVVYEPKGSKRGSKERIETINVGTQVQRIINWCTDYPHYYNLPPFLLEEVPYQQEPPTNGDLIEIDGELSRDICRYYVNCHTRAENKYQN